MRVLLLACSLVLALVAAGAALAGRGDPQEKLTAADNARARAIVLRKTDVGPGFKATPGNVGDGDTYCRALDESDLVLTGEAAGPNLSVGQTALASLARVYESVSDANALWRRLTSAAGLACQRRFAEAALPGIRIVSFGKSDVPRIGERSFALRLVWEARAVRVVTDLVGLQRGRALCIINFGSVGKPVAKAEIVRLAGVVARRMAKTMRGA